MPREFPSSYARTLIDNYPSEVTLEDWPSSKETPDFGAFLDRLISVEASEALDAELHIVT